MSANNFFRPRFEPSAIFAIALMCALVNLCGLAVGDEIQDAAGVGDLRRVQELVIANPDLANSKDINGYTPLICAAMYGRRDIAEWLLTNKADIEAGDSNGATPLDWAAGRGYKDVVELLLTHGAKVDARTNDDMTPLQSASMHDNKEVVELLLEHGANVNARDDEGESPLLRAACTHSTDVAEILLAHGANVNATDALHESALAKAMQYSTKEMVLELLLSRRGWLRSNYLWIMGTTGTAVIICFFYFRHGKKKRPVTFSH